MADGAVTFLLDRLTNLIQGEVQLLSGVRGEIEYIRDELERMKAFLRVADSTEESDDEIKVWVKQVREIAYEIEDVIDEFMLRLAHDHGQGYYAPLRTISCSVKNLKARYWIGSKIQSIKSKVCNISEGHRRYQRKMNSPEKVSSSTSGNKACYDRRGDSLLLEEAQLVGIDKPKERLIRWLGKGDSSLRVFSVVGMGGLGKTTLVKKVYDDEKVKTQFRNHAWINVSQSFHLEELLRDMIQQLFSERNQQVPPGVETMKSDKLKGMINEFLRESRYMLVFDDVWSIDDWDAFKYALPNNNCDSRVMLTTRSRDLASTSSKEFHGKVYELKPLSVEDSWILFCKKTFYRNPCPPHLKIYSEKMLERCGGLPIAIVALSGVLSTKDKSRVDEWAMVHRSLGVEMEGNDRFKSMKKILSLSYNDLPCYLRTCFLYLSIFPEDHLIERMRLIRLWIAEGFVEETEEKTLEEVAEGYLYQLFDRNLIQVAGTTIDGRIKTCRIHDLLREIILSQSTDQNFVAITSERSKRWPDKVRRLSVCKSLGSMQHDKVVPQLRSLLMFGMVDPLSSSSVLELLSGGLSLIKVLDLRGAPLETFPNEITKLFHLRYLSLRDTKVKRLPSSIRKLQNLETLDLKNAHVTELPAEILKLQKLRHLLVYRYDTGHNVPFHSLLGFNGPPKMGELLFLQKLSFIEANQDSGILLGEIGMLVQLRKLGIIKLRRGDGAALCSSIEKLSNLRSLSVTSIEEGEIIDLQHLSSPPQFLQRLYLKGRLEKLPDWIPSLHSLVKVMLRWSRLKDDPLESLGALPNLVKLSLVKAYDGKTLRFEARGFQSLKDLCLTNLKGLRQVKIDGGAMPNLEKLVIKRCKLLERVPSGIQCLTNLKLLELDDMPDGLVSTLKQDRQGGDYWKIAHIPKVYISYLKEGRRTGCYLR